MFFLVFHLSVLYLRLVHTLRFSSPSSLSGFRPHQLHPLLDFLLSLSLSLS